jgi:hypothetical protein
MSGSARFAVRPNDIGKLQNHRSATTTVSPGLRNVPGGTTACAAPSSPTRVSLMALRCARG